MTQRRLFATSLAILIILSFVLPANAEVLSLKTDKPLYIKGQDKTMTFTGTAEDKDINQIVNVIIYNPVGTFVKPTHSGFVGTDRTFEIKLSEKDFAQITMHGTYNATAFILKKELGAKIGFDYSVDGQPIHPTQTTTQPSQTTSQSSQTPQSSPTTSSSSSSSDSSSDGKSIQEKIQERIEASKKQSSTTTTDSEKSIEDKIKERIEASKNQGTKTNTTTSKTNTTSTKDTGDTKKPDSSKTNTPSGLDPNVLYLAIGVGAAAAVGVAIYAMKLRPKFIAREVTDTTSKESQQANLAEEEDYSLMILKNRLAKGEITVEQYNELKRALSG